MNVRTNNRSTSSPPFAYLQRAGSSTILDRLFLDFFSLQQARRDTSVAAAPAPTTGQGPAAACNGVKATQPAALQITAGSAEVVINAKGKVKKYGAPLGVWVDILPAGAAANATAETACHIKVRGGIKAGATKARKISVAKLTACFAALKLADCAKPLQARAQAVAGKKFGEGPWSGLVSFAPACAPCA